MDYNDRLAFDGVPTMTVHEMVAEPTTSEKEERLRKRQPFIGFFELRERHDDAPRG